VHLDEDGKVISPLYNYTKPLDPFITESFFKKYGTESEFSIATGSVHSGMLNSGMQMYWLKYTKPELFKKIKYSLHLPQYLSYLFTGKMVSEYTSIGCHTALWDYKKKDYHQWVYQENIAQLFPNIVSTDTIFNISFYNNSIRIGVGIHDSSSALLPYLKSVKVPFILVSTGTWSIALNPFAKGRLTHEDIQKGCINYMKVNGEPVKSSKLFLGNEYNFQVKRLNEHYNVGPDLHKNIDFNPEIFQGIIDNFKYCFKWERLESTDMPDVTIIKHENYQFAYHQLMTELLKLELQSIINARSNSNVKHVYVDGGFSDNDVYLNILHYFLEGMEIRTTNASLGSALGAAIAISDIKFDDTFLDKNYSLKLHLPLISKPCGSK
jgi:sugar (pentulose or hexulose) kinase